MIGVSQHRRIDVEHDLAALTRRAGVQVVMPSLQRWLRTRSAGHDL
jgi:hypothetical protein